VPIAKRYNRCSESESISVSAQLPYIHAVLRDVNLKTKPVQVTVGPKTYSAVCDCYRALIGGFALSIVVGSA
jgi:hypothetical protein